MFILSGWVYQKYILKGYAIQKKELEKEHPLALLCLRLIACDCKIISIAWDVIEKLLKWLRLDLSFLPSLSWGSVANLSASVICLFTLLIWACNYQQSHNNHKESQIKVSPGLKLCSFHTRMWCYLWSFLRTRGRKMKTVRWNNEWCHLVVNSAKHIEKTGKPMFSLIWKKTKDNFVVYKNDVWVYCKLMYTQVNKKYTWSKW